MQAAPILLLGPSGLFPVGALRQRLLVQFPEWRWLCGEDDDGGKSRNIAWRPRQLIYGRPIAPPTPPLLVEIIWSPQPYAPDNGEICPPPPHSAHLRLGQPTCNDPRLAERLLALLASALLDGQHNAGAIEFGVQFAPSSPWLDAQGAARQALLVEDGARLTPQPAPAPTVQAEAQPPLQPPAQPPAAGLQHAPIRHFTPSVGRAAGRSFGRSFGRKGL